MVDSMLSWNFYTYNISASSLKRKFKKTKLIVISRHSLMFHIFYNIIVICKMLGTAVAVKREIFPRDLIMLSLSKFSRIILPLAPTEVLISRGNDFPLIQNSGEGKRPEMERMVESEEFSMLWMSSILMYATSSFKILGPRRPLWKEWVENLHKYTSVHAQLDEVRNAWKVWKENFQISKSIAIAINQ